MGQNSSSKQEEKQMGDGMPHGFFTPEELKQAYKKMLLIRRFEERAAQLYGMGLIGGFCHLYIGQEAVVIGIQSALSDKDTIVTSYRDHGHMLACDMDPKGVMAELTGREGGYSKGKGGSMHMFSREKNFFGGHGIVGAQIPIGAGLGFSHKYKQDGGLCVTYMGDGAANQGQVYEAFNMASLWKLPTIFVIEDNKYGMGTSVDRSSASTEFYKRGEPWGIPGMVVDGMDVIKVREAAGKAVTHVREGNGPVLMHIKTYRYRGHSMSDPANYRTKEEIEHYRQENDPLLNAKQHLEQQGILDEAGFKEIESQVKAEVLESVEFAKTSPEPHPDELYTDVLVDPDNSQN